MSRAAYCDLGLMPYAQAHRLQLELAESRRKGGLDEDLFLAVEHPSVFTLGRRGGRAHLGVDEAFLLAHHIEVVPIERGGEITYHGPGQLVLYPIFDLRRARLSVGAYVQQLEEIMLLTAADLGVAACRDPRNHGVWVGNNKLGSIGIAIRHGISFHGMALNVNLDLEPFSWINPCGLRDIGMTSLAREGKGPCAMDAVKASLQSHINRVFSVYLHPVAKDHLVQERPFSGQDPT